MTRTGACSWSPQPRTILTTSLSGTAEAARWIASKSKLTVAGAIASWNTRSMDRACARWSGPTSTTVLKLAAKAPPG